MYDAGNMLNFLKKCLKIISKQRVLFVLLNWLFFVTMLLAPFFISNHYVESEDGFFNSSLVRDNALLMVLNIFLFNLLVSAFALMTLTGFLFFAISGVFFLVRAWFWGALLNGLSTMHLLIVLPTLILEGEGYVLAALAGIDVGLSWLRPQSVFKEEGLSRRDAFKRALMECGYIYVLVVFFLFVAAIVETITLIFLG